MKTIKKLKESDDEIESDEENPEKQENEGE